MQTASLVLGILALVGMVIAFLPCLGFLNWLNIPFSFIGLVIGIISVVKANEGESKTNGIVGLVLCGIAVVFGIIRLTLGGGVL